MASIKEVNKSIMYYSLYVIVFKFLGLYVLNRFLVQFSEMEIIFQISYDIDDLVCVCVCYKLAHPFFVGYFIYGLSYYYAKLSLFFRLS